MEKEQRSRLQKATQEARRLLEEEFSRQLLETYDINVAAGRWSEEPGAHLQADQRLLREKLLAWIEHRSAQINDEKEALLLALREMAFTALNRFVALKLMEARELVRPCVSGGLESEGFQEFTAVAQGLLVDQESSYRLYLETIFEDVSRELRALFDPRDPASLLWPKRTALLELLDILNRPELAELWREDETLGWIYQYFNGDAERKKMREESSAPRNSRELAVRNQFFTPRYVVEFLTDNTLGRIWYEMRQGDTGLKERCRYLVQRPNEIWLQPGEEAPAEVVADEAFSQEELLRHPVHIPNRPLKDPREIRMLDPACGSMHFGLYAFDLYLAIYEEAWEIAQGSNEHAKQGEAFAAFAAYAVDFASKPAFLREVPRLILQHNIHGVDIDPRATQIARLTLWLRAQRAWQEQGVEVAARPAITRSNVVCAEPMPGEKELLADFVDQQFPEAERGLVQQLLEVIFDKMQLAGEAGSLLKIEEEIRDAIDQAQIGWRKLAVQQQNLFSAAELGALGQAEASLNTDVQNLTKDFWIDIEERIYTALSNYAEQAQIGNGLQRRLFAEDAAQGFAFIDVCRKHYEVVLTNPPFGEAAPKTVEYIKKCFRDGTADLACAFTLRWNQSQERHSFLGAIITRNPICLPTTECWRSSFNGSTYGLELLADFGYGVLDAKVETVALMAQKHIEIANTYPAVFFPLVAALEKEVSLRKATRTLSLESSVLASASDFESVPGKPWAYWCPESVRTIYRTQPLFQSGGREVKQGIATGDDFRFLRLWWEHNPREAARSFIETKEEKKWVAFAKGGEYSPYLSDLTLSLNWGRNGAEVRNYLLPNGKLASRPQNTQYFFRSGVTFIRRTSLRLCCYIFPEGAAFSDAGPTSFFPKNDCQLRMALAYCNSLLAESLMSPHHARGMEGDDQTKRYDTGLIQRLPWPLSDLGSLEMAGADHAINRIIQALLRYDASDETNRLCSPSGLMHAPLSDPFHDSLPVEEILDLQHLLADVVGVPLNAIASGLSAEWRNITNNREEALQIIRRELSVSRPHRKSSWLIGDHLAQMIGHTFGRWDIRYATGEQAVPELPDPFAPLPICPPGQLQNAQGLPASANDVPSSYPVHIAWDGILVDDPNHPLDIHFRVREVIGIIWSGQDGESAQAIEQEACDILGLNSLRDYFRKPSGFFADHLKRYSKSRRQAPIYWQLSAGNGSYSAWLYYHRFTQDTLYRVLGDFVEPRIEKAEREQFELESQGGLSADAASLLHEVQALLQDLRLFKSDLELVAPLWNPNLNDGVIINHAILWRITPYTPWQKKCKECWDKLVKGDYDWAHLAFHLWPERVIPKCTTDRSLAIAHRLEDRLWQETNNGNWLPQQLTEADLQALIAEHSIPAVKSALERFLTAPPPVAPTRPRASRSTRSTGSSAPRRPRGTAAVVDAEATRQVLLALTAAPSDGLAKAAIADLIGVEANVLTAVIKQLKESGQIDQLGERRGARYVLSEQGRARLEQEEAG
jgi:hypothetical protein